MQRVAFVALCREVIPAYEDQFRQLFSRLALSVDWTREYQTISSESRTVSQLSFLDPSGRSRSAHSQETRIRRDSQIELANSSLSQSTGTIYR
jgi:hypothetical protein